MVETCNVRPTGQSAIHQVCINCTIQENSGSTSVTTRLMNHSVAQRPTRVELSRAESAELSIIEVNMSSLYEFANTPSTSLILC